MKAMIYDKERNVKLMKTECGDITILVDGERIGFINVATGRYIHCNNPYVYLSPISDLNIRGGESKLLCQCTTDDINNADDHGLPIETRDTNGTTA